MGIRQDFLMRMIEQLADTFQRIFASGGEQDESRALYEIEGALADVFRTRRELLFMRPEEMIEEFDPRLAAEVGRLFLKHAELSASQGHPQAAEQSMRLALRCLCDGVGEELSHSERDVNDLLRDLLRSQDAAALMSADAMADTWRDIFEDEARRQNYAAAEDALFHAVELADDPQDHVKRGLRFYQTLLKLPDEVLEEGDLPRDEVEWAIEDLQQTKTSH